MLPTPVSISSRRTFTRDVPLSSRYTINFFRSPARVTNLGFLLISAFTLFSVLLNFNHYFSVPTSIRHHDRPVGLLSTISRRATLQNLDHLIIVPGHAVWKGINFNAVMNEDEWLLESYQKGGGRISALVRHITHGSVCKHFWSIGITYVLFIELTSPSTMSAPFLSSAGMYRVLSKVLYRNLRLSIVGRRIRHPRQLKPNHTCGLPLPPIFSMHPQRKHHSCVQLPKTMP
jgi:hypothetical protein